MKRAARIVLVGFMAAMAITLWAAVVRAQEVAIDRCGDIRDLTATVAKEFGETPSYIGLVGPGKAGALAVVVFANPATGTFTLISRDGSNYCLIAMGTKWQPIEAEN